MDTCAPYWAEGGCLLVGIRRMRRSKVSMLADVCPPVTGNRPAYMLASRSLDAGRHKSNASQRQNLANPASKFLELPLLRQFTRYHLNRNRVEIRHPSHMFLVKFIAGAVCTCSSGRTQSDPLRGRAGRTVSALRPRPLRRRYGLTDLRLQRNAIRSR